MERVERAMFGDLPLWFQSRGDRTANSASFPREIVWLRGLREAGHSWPPEIFKAIPANDLRLLPVAFQDILVDAYSRMDMFAGAGNPPQDDGLRQRTDVARGTENADLTVSSRSSL
jgi:hypothetical protein